MAFDSLEQARELLGNKPGKVSVDRFKGTGVKPPVPLVPIEQVTPLGQPYLPSKGDDDETV